MKKIGITGGIGVGKTYVSNIFRKMNYPVYSSDVMAKELLENDDNLISVSYTHLTLPTILLV